MFNSEQRLNARVHKLKNMRIDSWATRTAAAWVVAVALVGYAIGTASLINWTMVAALALAPALVVIWFWHAPDQSMSERIREGLR